MFSNSMILVTLVTSKITTKRCIDGTAIQRLESILESTNRN
jgi:hypothetical protein